MSLSLVEVVVVTEGAPEQVQIVGFRSSYPSGRQVQSDEAIVCLIWCPLWTELVLV